MKNGGKSSAFSNQNRSYLQFLQPFSVLPQDFAFFEPLVFGSTCSFSTFEVFLCCFSVDFAINILLLGGCLDVSIEFVRDFYTLHAKIVYTHSFECAIMLVW